MEANIFSAVSLLGIEMKILMEKPKYLLFFCLIHKVASALQHSWPIQEVRKATFNFSDPLLQESGWVLLKI